MSDSPQREWRFYIGDMIGFAENFRHTVSEILLRT